MPTVVSCSSGLSAPKRLLKETTHRLAVERLIGRPVESCSDYGDSVVAARCHPFMAALHTAFCDHRSFALSPDMMWLLIAQGLASHVNANSESMREHFVAHEGREKIEVVRNDFIKGAVENTWEEAFDEFSSEIKQIIGGQNHRLVVSHFSTTGPVEKAANEVVLMDAMQSYFEYSIYTLCGIPEVVIEGTPRDWRIVAEKTAAIGDTFGLAWWTDRLLPTLESLVSTSDGGGDPAFWRSFYKWESRSGGDSITGWIVDFFPYLRGQRDAPHSRSRVFARESESREWSVETQSLPSGLSKAPFLWDYLGNRFEMDFVAGFTAYTQDPTSFAVRPKIGWAVMDAGRG